MTRLFRLLLLATPTLLLAACAGTPPATEAASSSVSRNPEVRIERVKQRFVMTPAVTRLRIHNPWGDVHLKSMVDTDLGIYAVVQRIDDAAPAPQFDFRSQADWATLEVVYAAPFPPGSSGRVDLVVYLPPLADIDIETVAGSIRGKQLTANLHANSRSGDILVASSGRLQLASQSGNVRATQIGGKWIGDAFLTSTSGLVELLFSAASEVALDVQSGVGIDESFGAALQTQHRDPHHLRGELGSGEVKLRLRIRSAGEVILRPFDR